MSYLPTPGARVRVIGLMPDDPCPIGIGEEGTVQSVHNEGIYEQIFVKWDSGRSLILLPTDPYVVVQ